MSAFDTGSVMNPPVLIEADHVSVTVGWDAMPEAKAYEIEISEGNPTGEWRSLSNKLTSTFVRKKNLAFDIDYFFRIRYTGDSETWGNFSDASNAFRVVPEACQMMNPPVVAQKDGVSVSLTWDEVQEAEGYKLRFREDKTSTCK
jgi:chitodextrinase